MLPLVRLQSKSTICSLLIISQLWPYSRGDSQSLVETCFLSSSKRAWTIFGLHVDTPHQLQPQLSISKTGTCLIYACFSIALLTVDVCTRSFNAHVHSSIIRRVSFEHSLTCSIIRRVSFEHRLICSIIRRVSFEHCLICSIIRLVSFEHCLTCSIIRLVSFEHCLTCSIVRLVNLEHCLTCSIIRLVNLEHCLTCSLFIFS